MKIEDFDWEELYKKAVDLMKRVRATEYSIATNKKTMYGNEPVVEVSFPKRSNCISIIYLNDNAACVKQKGYRKDNILYCVYGIYASRLSS